MATHIKPASKIGREHTVTQLNNLGFERTKRTEQDLSRSPRQTNLFVKDLSVTGDVRRAFSHSSATQNTLLIQIYFAVDLGSRLLEFHFFYIFFGKM